MFFWSEFSLFIADQTTIKTSEQTMVTLGVIYTSWPVHKPFRTGRKTERVKETEIEKEDKKIRKREKKMKISLTPILTTSLQLHP